MLALREIVQIILYVIVFTALTPLLGKWMAKIFNGERIFLSPVLGWLEHLIYDSSGIDSKREMDWKIYIPAYYYAIMKSNNNRYSH